MKREESATVTRHIHHAVALAMHAICHNAMTGRLQSGDSPQSQLALSSEDHLVSQYEGLRRNLERDKFLRGSKMPGDHTYPSCMDSDDTSRSRNGSATRLEESGETEEEKLQERERQFTNARSDSLESSGSDVNSTDHRVLREYRSVGTPSMLQPIKNAQLQWWMVKKSDYEVGSNTSPKSFYNCTLPGGNGVKISHPVLTHRNIHFVHKIFCIKT